jgi:hypothetical protein
LFVKSDLGSGVLSFHVVSIVKGVIFFVKKGLKFGSELGKLILVEFIGVVISLPSVILLKPEGESGFIVLSLIIPTAKSSLLNTVPVLVIGVCGLLHGQILLFLSKLDFLLIERLILLSFSISFSNLLIFSSNLFNASVLESALFFICSNCSNILRFASIF